MYVQSLHISRNFGYYLLHQSSNFTTMGLKKRGHIATSYSIIGKKTPAGKFSELERYLSLFTDRCRFTGRVMTVNSLTKNPKSGVVPVRRGQQFPRGKGTPPRSTVMPI